MFKQIVSQLSLSPSAVSQLTFYGRRLRAQQPARILAAGSAVLLVGLQTIMIALPPSPTNAAAPGDLIHGGFVSTYDLLNTYDANYDLQALYGRLGITRSDLSGAQPARVSSSDQTLKVISRLPHSAADREIAIGQKSYWSQTLRNADTAGANSYDVIQGRRSGDGSYFAVMKLSGDLVVQALPPAPAATPSPSPTASPVLAAQTVKNAPASCTALTAQSTAGHTPFTTTFMAAGTAGKGQKIAAYEFDFDDDTSASQPGAAVTHTFTTAGTYHVSVNLKTASGQLSPLAPACTVQITAISGPAVFMKSKSALNLTQNIDATTRPARAGDVIRYHLTTKNLGEAAGTYTVVEHLDDVLEYADIIDVNGGTVTDGTVSWPAQKIAPGAELTTAYTVKIKSPIPSMPIGASDRTSYNLRMDNVYGNAVQIAVTAPASKQFELAAANLPPINPLLALAIVGAVAALTLFFSFRHRQLALETKLLRGEYQGGA